MTQTMTRRNVARIASGTASAYPTHGTWAAVLLYLMAHGPGKLSIDAWIARRHGS